MILALMISVSGCYGVIQKSPSAVEAFLVVNDVSEARESLDGERHVFPDKGIIIGSFSKQDLMKKSKYIDKVYYEYSNVPAEFKSEFTSWVKMLEYKRMPLEEKLANIPDVEPIYNDMVMIEKPSLDDLQIIPRGIPAGADPTDTSSYMIGDVSVSVIFPESDESSSNTEDWTDEEIQEVKAEILNAMDWWDSRNENASLTFVYNYEERIPTQEEPIAGNSNLIARCRWMNDVMVYLGFGPEQYPDCTPLTFDYVNNQREATGTDWGFIIWAIDSSVDSDGRFVDGNYAFTVIHSDSSGGGPYSVVTYDNGPYQIENMDAVCAHETGHIFGALDQYATSGCNCNSESGYLYYANENCENNCSIDVPSIMKHLEGAFLGEQIDIYAKGQIGWQDEDEDGVLDIVDTIPEMYLNPFSDSDGGNFYFDGDSWITIFDAINPYYNNISINTISNVEYSVQTNGGGWSDWFGAGALDGNFDSAQELFEFIVGDLPMGDHEIKAGATNRFGNMGESNIQTIIATGIPPMCYETDDGYDIYHFGTVTDDNGAYDDFCLDGSTLLEYFCGEYGLDAMDAYCSKGCSSGKCNVGGGSCFIAGTKITMAGGSEKSIEEVQVGDKILSYNIEKGYSEEDVVVSLKRPVHDDMVVVKFGDSENTNTFDHPYFVKDKGWSSYKPYLTIERYGKVAEELMDVKQLENGDTIFSVDKKGNLVESKITVIQEDIGKVQTYIFSVEKNGNFFANGALVHNKNMRMATVLQGDDPYQ